MGPAAPSAPVTSAMSQPPEPARSLRYRRHQRMRSRGDFERAYRQGNRARGDLLIVVVVENGLPHARLGLSVGKRIWKRAVRRNRVRRVFREAFRLSQHELPAGCDLVLIPARAALEPELEATCRELVALAAKAHRRYRQKLEGNAS